MISGIGSLCGSYMLGKADMVTIAMPGRNRRTDYT